MPREDDGLGPYKKTPRYVEPKATPIADALVNFSHFLRDCWFHLAIFIGVAALIVWVVLLAIEEQREWNAFAASHDCKVIAKKRGEVFTTTSIGPNGQVVIGTGSTADQTAYHCNDGVTYWR